MLIFVESLAGVFKMISENLLKEKSINLVFSLKNPISLPRPFEFQSDYEDWGYAFSQVPPGLYIVICCLKTLYQSSGSCGWTYSSERQAGKGS